MKILNLFKRKEKLETRDDSWQYLTPRGGGSGGVWSSRQQEQLSVVVACVDLISTSLASLTPRIYSHDGTDKQLLPQHVLQPLLMRPNRHQNWSSFCAWIMRSTLLHGNGVAVYEDGQLWPIPWPNVSIKQTDNQLIYEYTRPNLGGAQTATQRVSDERVFHLRDQSDDGIVGVSVLRRARDVVNLSATVAEAVEAFFGNSCEPSGILSLKSRLSPEARKQARQELQEQFSGRRRSSAMLLDSDASWTNTSSTQKDNQLTETRDFQVVEICRLFGVSPILIGDMRFGTYTNSAEAAKHLHRFVLSGWAKKFQSEFTSLLLADGEQLELDQSDFIKGDSTERWQNYKIALEQEVLSAEDVRRLEGY